jgi:hypothetical protein
MHGNVSYVREAPNGLIASQAWTWAEMRASMSEPTQPWEIFVITGTNQRARPVRYLVIPANSATFKRAIARCNAA